MIDLYALLRPAGGRVSELPLLVIAQGGITAAERILEHAGAPYTIVRMATTTNLRHVRELAKRRRVDTGDARLLVLTGVASAPRALLPRLVALIDRSVATSRFVLVVGRAVPGIVGSRLWSRGTVARIDDDGPPRPRPESEQPPEPGVVQQSPGAAPTRRARVRTLYDKIVASAARGTRLDITARSVARAAAELSITAASVQAVLRAFGREAALRRHPMGLHAATHYAHMAALSQRQPFVALRGFVIELQASLGAILNEDARVRSVPQPHPSQKKHHQQKKPAC